MSVLDTTTSDIITAEDAHLAHNYHPLPVVISRGEGSWVTDVEGKRYLDLLSAYSALNFGHLHPAIVAVAQEQLTRLTHALGLVYARGEPRDGTYEVDHSASAVLIDPEGHQAGVMRPPFDAAKIAADLVALAGTR